MQTQAAILRAVGGPLSMETLEVPALDRGQVLVKILASGLCHSQLNEIRGRKGKEYIPHLMGHEAAGTVIDIGEGVTKVKKNDYVAVSWIKGSGIESAAPKYLSATGPVNAGPAATFLEHAIVSENRITPIDKKIPAAIGAILGCAVLTGMGTVRSLNIKPGQKVIVFGSGGIGGSAILMAHYLGAEVTAVDVVDWKLTWAKETVGVAHAIKPDAVPLGEFDFAIECSGNKQAMELAFKSTKDMGITVIAGNLEPGQTISIDPFALVKGRVLRGTWGGGSTLDADMAYYVSKYLDEKHPLRLDLLLTKTYPFSDIPQGLHDLEEGKLIRGVLQMNV